MIAMRKMLGMILLICILPALPLKAHETGFPRETLKKVFPDALGFSARKKTLTAEQLKSVEEKSGSKIQHNDNPLSYYLALAKTPDGSGVLGSVLMIDARGPKGGIDLAVGILRDGTVHRVVVVENKDEAGLASAEFLNQIQGKSLTSPLKVGEDIRYAGDAMSAKALLNAVHRGLHLYAAAQGK